MPAIWWMLWLQLCIIGGLIGWMRGLVVKTHAKAGQTKKRVDSLIPVAQTANATATAVDPITSVSGQAAYLATLAKQSAPAQAGLFSGSYTGPGNNTNAAMFSWLETGGSFNGLFDDLVAYVQAVGGVCNNIIDNLGDFNSW